METFFSVLLEILEWVTWVGMTAIGVTMFLIFCKDEDSSVRYNSMIVGGVMLAGCLAVLFLPVNKLHLLGWYLVACHVPRVIGFNQKASAITSDEQDVTDIPVEGNDESENDQRPKLSQTIESEEDHPQRSSLSEKLKSVARWILVLPGAVACAFLVSWPVHWLALLLMSANPDSSWSRDGESISFWAMLFTSEELERYLMAFATPFTIVKASAWIAPSRKFAVAIATSLIFVTVMIASYINVSKLLTDSIWVQIIKYCVNAVGAAIAICLVRKEQLNNFG